MSERWYAVVSYDLYGDMGVDEVTFDAPSDRASADRVVRALARAHGLKDVDIDDLIRLAPGQVVPTQSGVGRVPHWGGEGGSSSRDRARPRGRSSTSGAAYCSICKGPHVYKHGRP